MLTAPAEASARLEVVKIASELGMVHLRRVAVEAVHNQLTDDTVTQVLVVLRLVLHSVCTILYGLERDCRSHFLSLRIAFMSTRTNTACIMV